MLNQLNNNAVIMLLARVLIALIYVVGGVGIFTGKVPVEFAASKGIPEFMTWAGYIVKFFGGLFIVLGFQTRLAALGLVIFTAATAIIFHFPGTIFYKELTMIGGLLMLMVAGPGKFSIDEMKSSK